MAAFLIAITAQMLTLPPCYAPVVRAAIRDACVYSSGVNGNATGTYAAFGGGELALLRLNSMRKGRIVVLNHRRGITGSPHQIHRILPRRG